MTDLGDRIPTIETYRGVGLHDHQDETRLMIVRGEIDEVFDLQDRTLDLVAWAEVRAHSPESRLLAAALVQAQAEIAADNRRTRPPVDLVRLGAITAGLDSARWRDRRFFDSALAPRHPPGAANGPVRRLQPLD